MPYSLAANIILGHAAERVEAQDELEDKIGEIMQRNSIVRPDRFARDGAAYHQEVDDVIEAAGDPNGDYY